MRWLAVHLPQFPLEVLARGAQRPGPLAVSVRCGGRELILSVTAEAQRLGVQPGLSPAAARALTPDLRVWPRNLAAERAALERLATWCGQFTSLVSLEPPGSLLLEVAGSRRLFGGLPGLLARVRQGLARLGYTPSLVAAPTPLGALWLAVAGSGTLFCSRQELRARLAALPLDVLPLRGCQPEALSALGLRTLGELLRLPRSGLARRLGPELLASLDRALGQAPDPRSGFVPRPRFHARLALPGEVEDTEGLLFAARRLLGELTGFLLVRDGGVQELRLRLGHAVGEASNIVIGLLRPARETEHFFDLLRQRLERLELPAPVTELELRAGPVEPLAPSTRRLFPRASGEKGDGERLLEKFQSRLGEKRVCGLQLRSDHRPEYAWSYCVPGQTRPAAHRSRRPLWLLPQPQPLLARDGWPWRDGGKLQLEPERERIETGWWDGHEVRRDYFVAHARNGERLWVFRELHGTGRWFLHGIFG